MNYICSWRSGACMIVLFVPMQKNVLQLWGMIIACGKWYVSECTNMKRLQVGFRINSDISGDSIRYSTAVLNISTCLRSKVVAMAWENFLAITIFTVINRQTKTAGLMPCLVERSQHHLATCWGGRCKHVVFQIHHLACWRRLLWITLLVRVFCSWRILVLKLNDLGWWNDLNLHSVSVRGEGGTVSTKKNGKEREK